MEVQRLTNALFEKYGYVAYNRIVTVVHQVEDEIRPHIPCTRPGMPHQVRELHKELLQRRVLRNSGLAGELVLGVWLLNWIREGRETPPTLEELSVYVDTEIAMGEMKA